MADTVRHAVITGAAGGIGQALVRRFDAAGYSVIATDIEPCPADLPSALYLQTDLARTVVDELYAAETFDRIREQLNGAGLAVLVNNAALQILGDSSNLTRRDWRRTLDVNLLAPFIWTQSLLPQLERSQGQVINISSIHARLTKKRFVAYATSKAALSAMTRAMAIDLGGRVQVNAIEPAAIDTPMLRAGFAGDESRFQALQSCHPCGRIGHPDEVAACALNLASGQTPFLTGAAIALDGGIGGRLMDPV